MQAILSVCVPVVPLSQDERVIVQKMWDHFYNLDLADQEKILGWLLSGARAQAAKNAPSEGMNP
jgi:hypothetical protein